MGTVVHKGFKIKCRGVKEKFEPPAMVCVEVLCKASTDESTSGNDLINGFIVCVSEFCIDVILELAPEVQGVLVEEVMNVQVAFKGYGVDLWVD